MTKQKLLSIAIPSYNSEAYMAHAIESLLPGGDEVEILIVNDGSKDRTAEIADHYQAKYPGICKAIHQENGGHGAAVMAGLRNATGIYFMEHHPRRPQGSGGVRRGEDQGLRRISFQRRSGLRREAGDHQCRQERRTGGQGR